MPELKDIPQPDTVDLDREPLYLKFDEIRDQYALTLVLKTFHQYEQFRQQNHDPRWNAADALYFGWLPQRVWEGTTTPRSSLGVPLVFDQVETALPRIVQALFYAPDWFQVEAEEGGDPREAAVVEGHLRYLLNHDRDGFGVTGQTEIIQAIKYMLLYGLGAVCVEYDPTKRRPSIHCVDIRDLYVDPGTPLPVADHARSIVRRSVKSVEELLELKNVPGMNIPSPDLLYTMSRTLPGVAADQTKRTQEALRQVSYTPGQSDRPALPAQRGVEVLVYYSKDRIIWVLDRRWVAYNAPNPYRFVPYCFAPCYLVPGRFYPLGIADVQEGNQRTMEALLNARLDELHLALHPPRKQKRGTILTPTQQRWRPGSVFVVDDVKNFETIPPVGATTNVYAELQFLQTLAEMRTGVNSVAMGVPRPSNANRTRGGLALQEGGAMGRLQMLVQHIEDFLIIPLLTKLYRMVQHHSHPYAEIPVASAQGEITTSLAGAFYRPVRFRMLASSKMMTRERLSQVAPILIQFLTQGPMIEQLAKSGKTVDFDELFRLVQDATGVGRLYSLVRPMTPEEQQARQAPPPDVAAKMQAKELESRTRLQMGQMKAQAEIQKELIKKQPSPEELRAQAVKSELAVREAAMKLETEREKARLGLESRRIDAALRAEEAARKLEQADLEHQMRVRQIIESALAQATANDISPKNESPDRVKNEGE